MVAIDVDEAAVASLQRRSSGWSIGLAIAALGLSVVVRAMLNDEAVRNTIAGWEIAAAGTLFVIWLVSPLLPSSNAVSSIVATAFAALAAFALAVVDVGALHGLSATVFIALLGGALLGAVVGRLRARVSLRSGATSRLVLRLPLVAPVATSIALLYVPAQSMLGAWLGPPTALGVGLGAALAVLILVQDQLGQTAAPHRHASSDVAGAVLTRLNEVSRSIWLLFSDGLSGHKF